MIKDSFLYLFSKVSYEGKLLFRRVDGHHCVCVCTAAIAQLPQATVAGDLDRQREAATDLLRSDINERI